MATCHAGLSVAAGDGEGRGIAVGKWRHKTVIRMTRSSSSINRPLHRPARKMENLESPSCKCSTFAESCSCHAKDRRRDHFSVSIECQLASCFYVVQGDSASHQKCDEQTSRASSVSERTLAAGERQLFVGICIQAKDSSSNRCLLYCHSAYDTDQYSNLYLFTTTP